MTRGNAADPPSHQAPMLVFRERRLSAFWIRSGNQMADFHIGVTRVIFTRSRWTF
ncbi:hypothetical protein AYI69_g7616, partial [Smittium culicis]